MTFEEWYYEIEGFGLRCERAYDELQADPQLIRKWLYAAYMEGFLHQSKKALSPEGQADVRL